MTGRMEVFLKCEKAIARKERRRARPPLLIYKARKIPFDFLAISFFAYYVLIANAKYCTTVHH